MKAAAERAAAVSGANRTLPEAPELSRYLHPGQVHVSLDACAITTILGSCVAVCLWSPRFGVGGMNHFLLPHWVSGEARSPRFGNAAIEALLERLKAAGCDKRELRAKVFGGASMVEAFKARHASLGERNVAVALEILRTERIPVLNQDVGGERGRKLTFHTHEGSAWVKLL
jgi:chemotaxis protein CheD